MILLDSRAGSSELLPYFMPYDVPVELCQIEFGDLAFTGEGPDGLAACAIEHKTIHDLVASMRSGRLSGYQLPGLCESYDYAWVCVQGPWRCGDHGELNVLAGRSWTPIRVGARSVLYREVSNYLSDMQLTWQTRSGNPINIVRVNDCKETAAWVVGLWHWHQKQWDAHDSHYIVYSPDAADRPSRRGSFVRMPVGPVELVSSVFPGVGRSGREAKAFKFGKAFKTVHDMVNADVKVLCTVDGVGKKGAETIYKWLRGGP